MRRIAVVFLLCWCAWAQSDRGTITGVVTDPTASAVPDAKVTAQNQATKVAYSATSNQTGNYVIPQLPVGRYDVTVEAAGFRRQIRRDLDINIAQTLNLNLSMELGQVDQTVEVSAVTPGVETTTSDLGTVVNRQMVMDLPLAVSGNMRNPESFIFLAPGVTGDTGNTQINGSQSRAKEVLLDGVGSTSPESGGTLFSYPSVEAISEFKLLASNYSAEYGRTGGGFEIFTTKSGTNDWHGSVFDYLRNDLLDARGFYSKTTPVNRQNEYGAAIGGPIRIPKIYDGKNRTFFHFVYSGFRYRQGASNALTSIPPADFRTGNFSRLTDRTGKPLLIYDPATSRSDGAGGFTRDAFPNNIIPANRISSISAKIMSLLPATATSSLLNNFLALGATAYDRDQVNIKVDHSFSDRHRVSGFVYVNAQTQIDPDNLPAPFTNALSNGYRSRWVRLTDDYVISPAVLNHMTFGFTREKQVWFSLAADQDWPTKLGLTGVNTGAGNAFPYVTFSDGYATWGSTNGTKTVGSQVNNAFQLTDSVSWVHGNHSFKFGAEGRWLQTNGADFFGSQGNFQFNSLETALPTAAGRTSSGSSLASFLLGTVDRGQLNVLAYVPGNRYRYFATYVQDDWKVSHKLTLNLGLRYDIYFPRSESRNNQSGFDPTLPNPGANNVLGAIAFLGDGTNRNGRSSFADTWYKAFGPRFGFAYSLNEVTVVRGGYGIFYAPGNATTGLRSSQNFSFGFNASPVFATTDSGLTPAFNWDNGFPQNFAKPPMIDPTVANGSTANMIGRGDGRPPYFQNWSLSVQRELPGRFTLEAAYVGVKGTRLGSGLARINELDPRYLSLGSGLLAAQATSAQAQAANIALPYPTFKGSVAQALRPYPQYLDVTNNTNPNGNSTYHSLQAKAEKRMAFGLTGLVTYAWSKSISDANNQAGGGPGGQTYYNRRLEKAISTDYVPHSFALSFLYELPFGPGKRFLTGGGVSGKLAGGWTFSGIHQYQSGKPIVLTANNSLPLFNSTLRPNVNAGVDRRTTFNDPATDRWINPAAFSAPAPLTFGTAARSYSDLLAPANLNESWGLIKRTYVGERLLITLRGEFFNVFNRVVFGAPASNISATNFGVISSQANRPRQGQVALKIEF